MVIDYLTSEEMVDCLCMENLHDNMPWGDYYRKYISCEDGDVFGLYYKDFVDMPSVSAYNVSEHIKTLKNSWNNVNDRPWEYTQIGKPFALISRVKEAQEDLYAKKICKFNKPVITGFALHDDYPVGVYFPRELIDYKSLLDFHSEDLSDEEKELIFDKVELWAYVLMEHGVYPSGLYLGNILVNPNDHSDVVLGGLDGPSVCRVENENYVNMLLEKSGYDLKADTIKNISKLRDEYCNIDQFRI